MAKTGCKFEKYEKNTINRSFNDNVVLGFFTRLVRFQQIQG